MTNNFTIFRSKSKKKNSFINVTDLEGKSISIITNVKRNKPKHLKNYTFTFNIAIKNEAKRTLSLSLSQYDQFCTFIEENNITNEFFLVTYARVEKISGKGSITQFRFKTLSTVSEKIPEVEVKVPIIQNNAPEFKSMPVSKEIDDLSEDDKNFMNELEPVEEIKILEYKDQSNEESKVEEVIEQNIEEEIPLTYEQQLDKKGRELGINLFVQSKKADANFNLSNMKCSFNLYQVYPNKKSVFKDYCGYIKLYIAFIEKNNVKVNDSILFDIKETIRISGLG
jgi:hypothetical protein